MKQLRSLSYKVFQLCLLLCALAGSTAVNAQYQQKAVTAPIHATIGGYYEALPPGYSTNTSTNYPLLIFIHGLGEVGNGSAASLPLVLRNGPPKLINQGSFPSSFTVNGKTSSFIVISPQLNGQDFTGGVPINALIDYVVSRYRIDQSRIYVTGLSMGGGVTWNYAGALGSNRVTAIAPICGNIPAYLGLANEIGRANIPVWAFHNENDGTVTVANTRDWMTKLTAYRPAMNPQPKATIFAASGHDAWSRAYDPNYRENNMNVYEWMLQYSKGGTVPPPANAIPVANAGADQTIQLPVNAAQLSGSGTDANGTITAYSWSKVSGGAATIANPGAASTQVSGLIQGNYVFRLTVTDNNGATAFDDMSITVNAAATTPPVTPPVTPPATTGTRYIKVNMYSATTYNNSQWNNWKVSSSLSSGNFTYSDATASTVKAVLSQQTNVSDNGTMQNTTMCPPEVGRNTSYHTASRTLTLTGLNNSKTYNLEVYSFRAGPNTNNRTRFTVGSTSVDVLSDYNISNKASFVTLTPVNGTIVLTIANLNTYNYINGFTLTENGTGGATAKSATAETGASVQLFPNPVQDRLVLQVNQTLTGPMLVKITGVNGQLKNSFTLNRNKSGMSQHYISVANLASGEYIVTIQIGDWSESKTIIKN